MKTKVYSLLVSLLLIITFLPKCINAQERKTEVASKLERPVVYIEAGGNAGPSLSVHAELPIWVQASGTDQQLRVSIGISTTGLVPGSVPILLKYLVFGGNDWLEIGLGANFIYR